MPAETHQFSEPLDVGAVIEILADLLVPDLDLDAAAKVTLGSLDQADELSLHHLWDHVTEEAGERTIGDLDTDPEWTPETLADTTLTEVATWFQRSIDTGGVSDDRRG